MFKNINIINKEIFHDRKRYRNDLLTDLWTNEFNTQQDFLTESNHLKKNCPFEASKFEDLFNKFLFDPPACQSRIRRDTGRQRCGLRTPNRNFHHQLSRPVSIQLCRIWKHRSTINFEKETKQFWQLETCGWHWCRRWC